MREQSSTQRNWKRHWPSGSSSWLRTLPLNCGTFTARQSLTVPGRGPKPPAGAAASGIGVQSSAQWPLNLRQGWGEGMVPWEELKLSSGITVSASLMCGCSGVLVAKHQRKRLPSWGPLSLCHWKEIYYCTDQTHLIVFEMAGIR